MSHIKVLLSTLWIIAILNYLYCDIGRVDGRKSLKQYLTSSVDEIVGASILMEIPIIMILLSGILNYKANRIQMERK